MKVSKNLYSALRLILAALLLFGVVAPAVGQSVKAAASPSFEVDVNQSQMNFNTPVACTAGKDPSVYAAVWNVNDQCLYTNVFTGKDTNNVTLQVDAVVTIASIDPKAHINVFDLPDAQYNGRFNPVIYTDGSGWTGYEGVKFNIQFYNHTSGVSLATIGQADKVKLLDFFVTVIDIDGSSASLTEYVEISGFQSYQVDKNTALQMAKTASGQVRFRGISTSVNGLVFQSNDSVIAYYSEPIQSLNVVGGNTGPLGSLGSTSQRQFSYDFGASGGVTNSKFTNAVTHPTLSVAIDDGGAGRLYPNAGNSQLTAVPVKGITTIGSGRTVTLTFKNSGGTTLGTATATVEANGTYKTTVNASTWTRGPITVTASGSNAAGVAADPETASATMNRIPAAAAQSVTTAEDTAKIITLAGTDADGDALSYEIASMPQHGTLDTVNGNKVTYTPSPNYYGADTFTFVAKDGFETSAAAQVSITVSSVNDAPVADAKQLSMPQNTSQAVTLSGTDVDGDALTYAIQSAPQHGTLGPVSGSQVTYTPSIGYVGTDSFTYIAKDGKGGNSSPAVVELTITAVNAAPVAVGQQVSTNEDTAVTIMLLGTDDDGDTLSYSIQSNPVNGTLGPVNGDRVVYTPGENFAGTDSFTFIANDGNGGVSAPATVDITVININDIPWAYGQLVTTAEDTAVTVTLNGTDVDGDPLTYEIEDQPQHGTLSVINGTQVLYTPNPDYAGLDSFTFVAKDGNGGTSIPAVVAITVTAVEDPPAADPQQLTTDEDTPIAITLTGTDPDGDSLAYAITSGPTNGTLDTLSGSVVTYTPSGGYSGPDSFTFTVDDGHGNVSAPATVSITVSSVNHAPTAISQQVTTDEDTPVQITLTGTDPDGDSLTYAIADSPANGTLGTLNGSTVTYSPNAGFAGSDSFTFTVKDGAGLESAPVTVSITVNDVNHAPVASGQQVTTDEDTAVTITLTGVDIDGDALTYEIGTAPQHGTLGTVNGSEVTYTPNTGYAGADSFTFVAKDGNGGTSSAAVVDITVNHVNKAPAANGQQVTTDEDEAVTITLAGTDADGDTLTYEIGTAPEHGTLGAVSGNQVTYTPDPGYEGVDSFTFVVKDGNGGTSAPATVDITVNHVNHAPSADGQQVTTDEDTAVTITLTGTDADGDAITYEIGATPQHGTLSAVNGAEVTYTPNAGYVGTDSFTFVAKDGNGGTSTAATVDITVNHVNKVPTANGQQVTTDEDTAVTITLAGTDADGDALTYEIGTSPQHGTLGTVNGAEVTYTPNAGYVGTDSFTFVAKDGNGGTSPAAPVDITVNHVNKAPAATGQQVTTNEDTAVTITLAGTDADGDALTYEIGTSPQHGTLGTVNGAEVTYTPNAGYVGTDSFTFVAKDGNGGTSPAAPVDITVNHVNKAPVATGQQVTTDEDTAVTITLAGTDADGDTLTYEIGAGPQHGTLGTVSGNQVTYTPDPGYEGTDSFTFVAKDGNGGTSTATVNIMVNHVNEAPVANAQQVTTDQEIPVTITLTGSDAETGANQLQYSIVNGPEHGRLTGTGSELTYTPDNGYVGTDSFTFKVNDSEQDSAPAAVTIQVQPLTPLDGWVGSRAQGETSPYVIVTPGSPLKLSAVSAVSAKRVVATVNGVPVELSLVSEADGTKVWNNIQYRLSDAIAAGDYKASFVAYDAAGQVTQEEKAERKLEDNAYHIRTEVSLRGTITDQQTGLPIGGAIVTLYDLTGTVKLGGPFTTEADGKYHFDSIRTGDYLIVVKSDGYGTRSNMIQALPDDLVSTVIERNYELVRFNLDLSASPSAIVGDGVTTSQLTAVLKDKDGKPIAGVEVEFSAPRGSFVDGTPGIHQSQKAITNAQGVAVVLYRSDKIEGILSQAIPVTAKVDDQEHQLYAIEQVIVTFQPASIKGVVTSNTDADGDGHPDPIAGTIVRIVKDFDGDGIIDFSAEAVTGPDGSYTIAIPRGEEDYTVSITRTITLGDQSKTITIQQPARAGTVTGAGGEVFASKKTISGIINSKQPNGGILLSPPVASNLKVYLKDAQGSYILDETTGEPKGFVVGADGVFTATNLTQGEYSLEVRFLNTDGQEIIVNQRPDGSLPKVSVTVDGQLNIEEELIDPYGTITDSKSGEVIEGVHVVLYYADTKRNRDNGVTPNTQVVLPVLTGFAPNDNVNPQSSDIYGKYAYMVYAHTDYYLVAAKSGYDTYTSPTISVEKAIVRHDIVMNKPVYTGGGSVTPTPAAPPTTNVSVEQSVYPEESEVPVKVTYDVASGSITDNSVKLELPAGVTVVDLDGGKLEGSAIVWPISSKTGEFHPVLKLPLIDGKEKKIELVSSFVNGKGEKTGAASVILSIVKDKHEHVRYIQGYPDGNFKSNRSLTRAELAAIMARLIGKYDGADPGYKDVDSGFWAYGYIKAVTEAGLFTGYTDNRFLPNQPVSRAELAVVMVRYLGLKAGTPVEIHFSDIRNHWAMNSIEALYRNHMISGYENGTFKPANSIKRVEAVTLINHMLFRGPLHDIEPTFPDVPANYWGFGHIEEASVSHESTYDEKGEEHFIAQIEDEVK